MKRKNTTRSALFTSIISLLLCVSMLVGTTFAWFTDEVKSGVNTIAAGNLDVELYHGKTTNPTSKVDASTKLFTDTKNAEIELWEPGVVAYTNLKVANDGNLALKYQMALSFTNANTVDGKSLADVLKIALIPGGVTGTTREAVLKEAKTGTALSLQDFKKSGTLEKGADSDVFGLVVYWPDNNSNEFDNQFNLNNGKTADDGSKTLKIDLGITLFATQLQYEEDSFGSDYDENIWEDAMFVASEEDLVSAIAAGETAIVLEDDIALTSAVEIPEGATVNLNLNGKTITGNVGRDADGNRVHVIVNNGNAVIKNGVITSAGVNGGSAIYNADGATLTVENVTLNGAPQEGSTWPSYTVNNSGTLTVSDSSIYGVQGIIATNNTANTTVNNVIAYRDGWSSGHVFYTSSTAKVTINGGTYTNDGNGVDGTMFNGGETVVNGGTFIVKEGAYFALSKNSTLTVNGGDFSNIKNVLAWGGTMSITGGTFGFDPTTYVADGYQVLQAGGMYFVVPDGISNVVTSRDELQAALDAATGDTTIVLAADITGDVIVSQKEGVNIVIDGADYKYDGTIYVYGNSRNTGAETLTIKNVNFVTTGEVTRDFIHSYGDNTKTEQRYAHNVTIEDCTFTNENGGTVVAARFRQAYNITIQNCEVDGLFSVLWADGGNGITIDNVTANCEYEGIGFGTCSNVTVKNSNITVTGDYGYGVRVDANANGQLTVEGSTFTADASVVVRYATGTYTATLNRNTLNGDIVVTSGNYKQGVALTAPTGDVKVIVDGAVYVETTEQLINAIKYAPVGQTTYIALADGTYADNIDITVAALGQSGGDVVIKAMEGAKPVITGTVTLGYREQTVGATMYNANVTFEGITFDHEDATLFSIEIGDVKSLNLVNCTIIGSGETGIHAARGNATGPSKITGCTFINAALQGYGNYCTDMLIEKCTFNNSCINIQAGNGVTVQGCIFNNTLTDANNNESFYVIRSNSTPITVAGCTINIDSTVTGIGTPNSKGWGVFVNRGTTNWTVSDVQITLTEAAQLQTALEIAKCTSTGAINMTDVTVNGVLVP